MTLLAAAVTLVVAELAACWQHAAQFVTAQPLTAPSGLFTVGAIALAGLAVAVLAQSRVLAGPLDGGPMPGRSAAFRRQSWAAVFQRQLNPDAAGHVRPRAPAVGPTAA